MTSPDLIERLEKAEGPDRQLDREIAKAIDPTVWKRATNWASMPCVAPPDIIESDAIRCVPAYTESLDAALALAERVLPGWCWEIRADQNGAYVQGAPAWWSEGLAAPDIGGAAVDAPTPALALCAALLKAHTGEGE